MCVNEFLTSLLDRLFSEIAPGITAHPARADFAVVGENSGLLWSRLPILRTGFHVLEVPRFDASAVVAAKGSVHDVFLMLKRTKPRQISLAGLQGRTVNVCQSGF
jgi:hypothetical protein